MRISAAALLVLVGMIAGYALRGAPVSAQSMLGSWLPFTPGEAVRFSLIDFPEGSTRHHLPAAFFCSASRAWKLFSLRSTYCLKPSGSMKGLGLPPFSSRAYFSVRL